MGLDQYAYVKTPKSGEEGESPKCQSRSKKGPRTGVKWGHCG